jgi:hypothetical protein
MNWQYRAPSVVKKDLNMAGAKAAHPVPVSVCAGLVFLFASVSAHADAIDGNWCRADGKRMSILGPDIVTPGGQQTRGHYSRHAFDYVIPAGESGAGDTVFIILLSEYLAHARQGSTSAPVEEWRRCQPDVS